MSNFSKLRLLSWALVVASIGCGPAPDEVTGSLPGELNSKSDAERFGRQTRPVSPNSYVNPLEVRYTNNGSEVRMNFDLAASELDLNFTGERKKDLGNVYTFEDVNRLIIYYRLAQENIGSNNLDIAEFNTNEALKIVQIPELFNMKGTLYFLKGDTVNASVYWNKAKSLTDSLNKY
jgi:urease beta subunit